MSLWQLAELLAIFTFVAIEDFEVVDVATFADDAFVYSAFDGATGFACVGAGVKSTSGGGFEYFGEEMVDFVPVHINEAEAFNTRGVDDKSVAQFKHFVEGGCVRALVVCLRYFAGTQFEGWIQCVDNA